MREPTGGERTVRTILGEPTDRAPYGVGIGWGPWESTLERWREESGNPELSPAKEFGFDAAWSDVPVELGIFPRFEAIELERNEEFVIARDWRGITMRNRHDRGSMPEFLDYPVKNREDWERLKEERLRIDPARAAADWRAFTEDARARGTAVRAGTFPYGVFGTPRDLLGAEGLLLSFYTQADLVRDMMNHLTDLWIAVYGMAARHARIEHIHIWEDMSGRQGSLISPKMAEEFMMPCYDRIAEFARGAGIPIISVDTDGEVSELVGLMTSHGVNLIYPFEVQAGNDILEYRRRYPELAILGGLDKRALAAGRHEIDRELARAREMLRHGRYIAGFDHLIPPDVPWENYRYAALRMKDICYGG